MSAILRRAFTHTLHLPPKLSRHPATLLQTRILSTNPQSPTPIPKVVPYLGYGGAVPFVVGGLGSLLLPDGHLLARATQLYGSAILSFLGGVHWGLALRVPTTTDFVYSVTPSLVAWVAALAPAADGLPLLSASFVAAWAWDELRFRGSQSVPRWYSRLRRPLTVAAAGGCAIAWSAVRERVKESDVEIREADAVVVSTSAYEGRSGDADVGEE